MRMRFRERIGPTPPSRWRKEGGRQREIGVKVIVRGILEEQLGGWETQFQAVGDSCIDYCYCFWLQQHEIRC